MEKFINKITASTLVYPTSTTGISGSTGVAMGNYREAYVRASIHRLPDGKGEGVTTLSLYENTQSAWGGASAVTVGVVTASLTSVSDVDMQINIRTAEMSTNDSKTYLNAYITNPTAGLSQASIYRLNPRYKPQN